MCRSDRLLYVSDAPLVTHQLFDWHFLKLALFLHEFKISEHRNQTPSRNRERVKSILSRLQATLLTRKRVETMKKIYYK